MFVKGTLKKAGLFLTLAVLPFLFGYFIISLILFSILAFIMQFFRDPNRRVPSEKGVVVAPADGRVLKGQIDRIEIVEYNDPLMKHILEKGKKGLRVSTFMSPFDVHVNRSPVSGKIVKTKHFSGKFKLAFKDAETETEKEKNLIVIDSQYGKIGVIQIAGFVARRIVQYVDVGDKVEIGERLGMIKFGSRVDLIVPYEKCELMVKEGEKPKAAETIIAKMIIGN